MEDIYNYVYIWNKPRFQGIFLQLYCIYHFSTYFIIYHIKGFVLIIIIIILIYIYIYIYAVETPWDNVHVWGGFLEYNLKNKNTME